MYLQRTREVSSYSDVQEIQPEFYVSGNGSVLKSIDLCT